MADAVLIDTWGWLALGHRRDAHHQEVKAFYQTLQEQGVRLYTTDYIWFTERFDTKDLQEAKALLEELA